MYKEVLESEYLKSTNIFFLHSIMINKAKLDMYKTQKKHS